MDLEVILGVERIPESTFHNQVHAEPQSLCFAHRSGSYLLGELRHCTLPSAGTVSLPRLPSAHAPNKTSVFYSLLGTSCA